MDHEHITKVIGWGIKKEDGNVIEIPIRYGCTKCEVESDEIL